MTRAKNFHSCYRQLQGIFIISIIIFNDLKYNLKEIGILIPQEEIIFSIYALKFSIQLLYLIIIRYYNINL